MSMPLLKRMSPSGAIHSATRHQAPALPLFLKVSLALVLVLNAIPGTLAANSPYACSTPTTFASKRLPAIVEVENMCHSTSVAMCIEFAGTNYLIRTIAPREMDALPTVHLDCWILRATNCHGPILLTHSVGGSQKLSPACMPSSDNEAGTSTQSPGSVGLDCALTLVPELRNAYTAALSMLPVTGSTPTTLSANPGVNAHLQADESTPVTVLHVPAFLLTLLTHAIHLARHGVPLVSAIATFDHARALMRHITRCRGFLRVGTEQDQRVAVPVAYLALYGSSVATLVAQARHDGAWVEDVPSLTNHQKTELMLLWADVDGDDVAIPLPTANYPAQSLLDSIATSASMSMSMLTGGNHKGVSVHDSFQAQGDSLCGADMTGHWHFWRLSVDGGPPSNIDCCSKGCFLLDASFSASTFSTHAFVANCCVMCNMAAGCNSAQEDLEHGVRSALEGAEIHVPPVSDSSVAPPVRMIEVTV